MTTKKKRHFQEFLAARLIFSVSSDFKRMGLLCNLMSKKGEIWQEIGNGIQKSLAWNEMKKIR